MGNDKAKYVTLPYDFVPFADQDKRTYPYYYENIPKHNDISRKRISGVITYKIIPESDLVVEVRGKMDGGHFISGSQIRGRVRTNLEILSNSYPEFIDRSPLLYRDISNDGYRERILKEDKGIERSVQVGFLRKVGNDFYVTPAQKIGDKNFISIKEHRLMQMKVGSSKRSFFKLFDWDNQNLTKLNELQSQIDKKTEEIKNERVRLKEKLSDLQSKISDVFMKEYSFNKKLIPLRNKIKNDNLHDYKSELDKLGTDLFNKLKEIEGTDSELYELFEITVERWKMKAETDLIYRKSKRTKLKPYQKNVFIKRTENNGIEEISFEPSDNYPEKGYLFNSTDASSKRSHYFVLEPVKGNKSEYRILELLKNGYDLYLKKFRTNMKNNNEIKQYYDIFENYDELIKLKGNSDGLIVFFDTDINPKTGADEIKNIGRTPYFKLNHKTSLADIIGTQEPNKVDYANALFGFIKDDKANEHDFSYKSRLRFGPADIIGKVSQECVDNLVLMTPQASASAMYLQQPDEKNLRTYEDVKEKLQLNGYKYYHVLQNTIEENEIKVKDKKNNNIISSRKVLKKNGIQIRGKIYFHHISKEELGLLLLSIDWKELRKSNKYSYLLEGYAEKLDKAYELIGGAKPYGYGKVKIEIQNLQIQKNGSDFESLINSTESIKERYEYIDKFMESINGDFDKDRFKRFIQSKIEVSNDIFKNGSGEIYNPIGVNWENISERIAQHDKKNGAGYLKNWRLKPKNKDSRI